MLNNWGLKLISLVLAFLLWFLVVQIGDPKDDRDMGIVQVKLINTELLDKENKVYEVLDDTDTVRVTVYAPKSVFTQLRTSDITAEADVSKLTDINTIPIEFTTTTSNVVSIQGSHDVIKLNIENKASKYVTLNCTTVGAVADGYMVSSLVPDQNRIEVSGPSSVVEKVKYAGAQIDVSEASTNLTVNVDIHLYDVTGTEVEHAKLVKNVNYVRVVAEVLAVKDVPVTLAMSGDPADGFMVAGELTQDVESVRIAGTVYALSRISRIEIPETALDITGASEQVVTTIDIREYLPDNVKLADSSFNGKMTVTIPIQAIVERTIEVPVEDISVTNVPEDYKAEIMDSAEEILKVEIAGLKDQVDLLYQNGIEGVVDIAGWMEEQGMDKLRAGNYNIPVTFELSENVTLSKTLTLKIGIKSAE